MNLRRTLAPWLLGAALAAPILGQERGPHATGFGPAASRLHGRPSASRASVRPRPGAHSRSYEGRSIGRGVHSTAYRSSYRAPQRFWIPGAYESVSRQVWIPGTTSRVWEEPRFALRFDSWGNAVRVQVGFGGWREVHHPGRYEHRRERVWRPGHWATRV